MLKQYQRKNKSNLIYNRLSFYSYIDNEKFDNLSFKSRYTCPLNFYDDLKKLIKIKLTNLGKIKQKKNVYNTVSDIYNKSFENYYDEYDELSDAKKDNLEEKPII